MRFGNTLSPSPKNFHPETRLLILQNKKDFDFFQDTKSFIDRNKIQLKNLSKKAKEKQKMHATNPYYTITIMNKIYNEYFMNNPEVLDILREFNTTKGVEELKIIRTQEQIKRIFLIKSLGKKDRKLLYDQMVYEFNPIKQYHDLNYCQNLTEFLNKNKGKFLKE